MLSWIRGVSPAASAKGICCFRFLVSRVEPNTSLPLFFTQGLFIVVYDLLGFITKFHQF